MKPTKFPLFCGPSVTCIETTKDVNRVEDLIQLFNNNEQNLKVNKKEKITWAKIVVESA
uniref:Uncharacterized protein n=1 Tax=Nelumbo nucifera TaxID=4432 RepID=A0A822YAW8_NELNU|nr:TPA_asm: hypothetical protein HUJ06_029684 [Nelumbo nucifera]